ncbi:hypothetical protein FLAVO9AF_30047 [Flavobacterium sp. 9AF]|uniref:hypothetical protein n=1 Tax=Flavobacterium sp. 9AF TaxID=2653142 RepID=UPI0012F35BAD|nr:hypothetical protein [Flavobacterium sp. 9AF]VXB84586.1 hypothetical protein FLAVO9AF_30047 [Flavobacterium sp. 9AF]
MDRIYQIRKQNNQIGNHAGFTLNCSFKKQETSIKTVDFAIDEYEAQWKEATLEGIAIFYAFYKEHFSGELTITIKNIKWFPVDTRDIIVTYVIIRALCEWFQLDFKPILDQYQFESVLFLNDFSFETKDDIHFFIN